ncbi:DUF502 domain-containing protein [Motiliproteus sediminis]|uniref:DUF502 domain-containing protein n=1 Tax=Motiliproteus sediminis TaxID=1468178 RepID=UPI001AEF45F6|nr:DUF502 domain-containing protein [Motiliproteus sediminis]
MRTVTKYFFQGLLVLLPLLLTFYLVNWVFQGVNETLFLAVGDALQSWLPRQTEHWSANLLGLGVTLGLIVMVGWLASHWLGQRLLRILERLLERIPVVKMLHGALRDLITAFIGERKSFDRPVYVELPQTGGKLLGFITSDAPGFEELPGHVAVYLPQSYNIAGNLVLFPRDRVHCLDITSSELTAFLLSGGVSRRTQDSG